MDHVKEISDDMALDTLTLLYRKEPLLRNEKGRLKRRFSKKKNLSELVRSFLETAGIRHLDQIDKDFSRKDSLMSFLDVPMSGRIYRTADVQRRVAELAGLSYRLQDYQKPTEIIEDILERNYGSFNSFYFDEDLIGNEAYRANIELLFETNKDLRRIEHLDQIDKPLTKKDSLMSLLGVPKKGGHYHIADIQKRFVELGTFSSKLKDYENPQDIVREILSKVNGRFKSYYFNKELVGAETYKENIDLLFKVSEDLRRIRHLDQIGTPLSKKSSLINLLGVSRVGEKYRVCQIQKRIAKLRDYSSRLREYDNPREIVNDILSKVNGRFKSYYFNEKLVGKRAYDDNIDLLFEIYGDCELVRRFMPTRIRERKNA